MQVFQSCHLENGTDHLFRPELEKFDIQDMYKSQRPEDKMFDDGNGTLMNVWRIIQNLRGENDKEEVPKEDWGIFFSGGKQRYLA